LNSFVRALGVDIKKSGYIIFKEGLETAKTEILKHLTPLSRTEIIFTKNNQKNI